MNEKFEGEIILVKNVWEPLVSSCNVFYVFLAFFLT